MVGIISLDISHLYKGMISLYNQKNIRIRIRNTSLIPEEEIVYITVAPFRTKYVAEGHEAWFRLLDLIAHPSDIGGCDCDWSAGKHCIFWLLFWCLASDFYLLLLWPNKHHNTLHLLRSFLGWLLFFPVFMLVEFSQDGGELQERGEVSNGVDADWEQKTNELGTAVSNWLRNRCCLLALSTSATPLLPVDPKPVMFLKLLQSSHVILLKFLVQLRPVLIFRLPDLHFQLRLYSPQLLPITSSKKNNF